MRDARGGVKGSLALFRSERKGFPAFQGIFAAFFLAFASCVPAFGQTRALSLFPLYETKGALGEDVDMEGYVSHNIQVAELNFGEGFQIPLKFNFSSRERMKSPYLGEGWCCRVLESKAVLLDERTYAVTMLGGKTLYFYRNKDNPNVFEHRGGQWKGTVQAAQFMVENRDGSSMTFLNGTIDKLKTRNGRTVYWNRQNGAVTSLGEQGKEPVLSIEYGNNFAKKMTVCGYAIQLEQDLATLSLGKITWPSGKALSFSKKWDEKGRPMLEVSGLPKETRSFTWDPATRRILADKNWTYQVDPKAGGLWPGLSRTNLQSKLKEAYHYNTQTGITTMLGADRSVKKEYEFLSPGPLFRKLHKVEKIRDGKVETIERYVYDENGNRIKEFQAFNGSQVELRYSEAGKLTEEILDGRSVSKLSYDDQGNFKSLTYTPPWMEAVAEKAEAILNEKK